MAKPLLFSVDAETNGLWGDPFALAAMVVSPGDGKIVDSFLVRCPISGPADLWVTDNVLPAITSVEETHKTLDSMLAAFAAFYLEYRERCEVIAHVAFPVETSLFHTLHKLGHIGDWEAPFPLLDTSTLIHARGENAISAEEYLASRNLAVNTAVFGGGAHNPMYDCAVAAAVYRDIMSKP